MSDMDLNGAAGLETLGNLILHELRLIRNDMKEEVRRLGNEIKLLHSAKIDDVDDNTETDLFNWQQNLLRLFGDVTPQKSNFNEIENANQASCLKEHSNVLPKEKIYSKANKNSLTDIVNMLKSKNDSFKQDQLLSHGLNGSDCLEINHSLKDNSLDNAENELSTQEINIKDYQCDKSETTVFSDLHQNDSNSVNESSSHSGSLHIDLHLNDLRDHSISDQTVLNNIVENGKNKFSPDLNKTSQDCNVVSVKEENSFGNDTTSTDFLQLCESMANFRCQFCKKPFRHYSSYQSHLRTHTGEKPFVCNLCNKTFSHKGNLKTHMLCHSNEKPFVCELCNKTFVQKSTLKNHLRTHTGEKPFACNICSKRFAHRGNLTQHLRLHRNIKPHVCEYCDKRFLQKCSLIVHLRSHTGEKPFSCSVCGKAFARKAYLKQHMHLHNQEKRFSCPLCEKTFSQKGNLNAHMVRHTKNEIYQCDVCKKSFKQHSYLVAHREIHNM